MKKIILSFFLFLFLALPVKAIDFPQMEDFPLPSFPDQKKVTPAIIFSDPDFTQATHQFSPSQTIYLKIETLGSGDQEKTARLLDAQKNQIQAITLNQAGSGPFVFTASLAAPSNPCTYYLDIKIKSQSFSYASQQNLQVGEQSGSVSVLSEAVSEVNQTVGGTESLISPSPFPSPEEKTQAPPGPLPPHPASLFSQIKDWFKTFFSYLSDLFKF